MEKSLSKEKSDCDRNHLVELLEQDGPNIMEEEFDFDIASSPSTSCDDKSDFDDGGEDEEEVFFGPVGHKEKCVASVVQQEFTEQDYRPLSPLNEKQWAEIVKEAQVISVRISCANKCKEEPLAVQVVKTSVGASKSSSCSSGGIGTPEVTMSPGSRLRRETFIVSTSPAHLLPPAVAPESQVVSTSGFVVVDDVNEVVEFTTQSSEGKEKRVTPRKPVSRSATFSVRGSKLPGARQRQNSSAGQYGGLKKPNKTGDDSVDTCSLMPDTSGASVSSIPIPSKRTLPQPSVKSKRLTVPSKPTSHQPASASVSVAQHNRLATGSKPPLNRLQLLKHSGLSNRKTVKSERPTVMSKVKSGPMKAMLPAGTTTSAPAVSSVKSSLQLHTSKVTQCTPIKPDTLVQPKKLLQETLSPSTPKKSSASSQCCTPGSVTKSAKRRSFLPTPVKRLVGSTGTRRPSTLSSDSSTGSQTLWNADSPVFADENTYPGKSKARKPINSGVESPMVKARRPLVQHTPQAQVRKPSLWSPVVKQRPVAGEEFYACTKRPSSK